MGRDVLDFAASTGVVSRLLAEVLPAAKVLATDLNPAMLDVAAREAGRANLAFAAADAGRLPFADHSFDLVLAQFGAMFWPDKVAAFGEARRVLRPGGTLLFNVWDRLGRNPGSAAVHVAVGDALDEPRPRFLARTLFSYHEPAVIRRDLAAAGFGEVTAEQVSRESAVGSAPLLARGLCCGTPLADKLALHPPEARARALEVAVAAPERTECGESLPTTALVATTHG